jgi:hypothetical protein
MLNFAIGIFCAYWEDHGFFFFFLSLILYYIYWLAYCKPSLHLWNETNLFIILNIVLLSSLFKIHPLHCCLSSLLWNCLLLEATFVALFFHISCVSMLGFIHLRTNFCWGFYSPLSFQLKYSQYLGRTE